MHSTVCKISIPHFGKYEPDKNKDNPVQTPRALKRNETHSLKKQHVIELDYMYYRDFFRVRSRNLAMYYL